MAHNNNAPKGQEYIDIPLDPDQTPLHLHEKLHHYSYPKTNI